MLLQVHVRRHLRNLPTYMYVLDRDKRSRFPAGLLYCSVWYTVVDIDIRVLAKGGGGRGAQRPPPPYSVCATPCEKVPPYSFSDFCVFFTQFNENTVDSHYYKVHKAIKGTFVRGEVGVHPVCYILHGKTILDNGKMGHGVTFSHARPPTIIIDLARTLDIQGNAYVVRAGAGALLPCSRVYASTMHTPFPCVRIYPGRKWNISSFSCTEYVYIYYTFAIRCLLYEP